MECLRFADLQPTAEISEMKIGFKSGNQTAISVSTAEAVDAQAIEVRRCRALEFSRSLLQSGFTP